MSFDYFLIILLLLCYFSIHLCMIQTETEYSKKIRDRDAEIIDLWNTYYYPGKTQITPLAESIGAQMDCSLSTVKRIVKHLIKR